MYYCITYDVMCWYDLEGGVCVCVCADVCVCVCVCVVFVTFYNVYVCVLNFTHKYTLLLLNSLTLSNQLIAKLYLKVKIVPGDHCRLV